ncbi:MAG TPA: hypothetical protein VNL16_15895 [Chloroflexota bacterium]|nr:hypothetical protein [Chloroflexota bacterium]
MHPSSLDRIPSTKGVSFGDRSPSDPRYLAVKAQYPRGVEAAHRSTNEYIEFYSYQVENTDLVAADPSAFRDRAPIPAVSLNELNPQ